jgi:hypothetical protein
VVEAGPAWEVFVPEPDKTELQEQPYIIRARTRKTKWIQARYGELAQDLKPEASYEEAFYYQQQVASLNARALPGWPVTNTAKTQAELDSNILKEYFEAPSLDYPQGRYIVTAGGIELRALDQLPYGFMDLLNPYPCESMVDVMQEGQFWNTTYIEQMIGPQREYNGLRTIIRQHLKLLGKGKLMAPTQANLPDGAWSSEPEKITYDWIPGMPMPTVWSPANIASDAWRLVDLLREEMDVVSQIHPNAEGMVGGTNSGFQVNLLQEASDSAHAPVIRQHERAWQGMYYKIRRIVKAGYTLPRMLTVVGKHYQPEVLEFSADQLDENADIIVRAGSSMPDFKAAKIQAVQELYTSGLLGDPADPDVRRKALGMIEMGDIQEAQEVANRDLEAAKLENDRFLATGQIPPPQYYENHVDHHTVHTDLLKSPEAQLWPEPMRMALVFHDILTLRFISYPAALAVANEYGMAGMVPPPPGPPQQAMPAPGPQVGGPGQPPPPGQAAPPPPGPSPASQGPGQ